MWPMNRFLHLLIFSVLLAACSQVDSTPTLADPTLNVELGVTSTTANALSPSPSSPLLPESTQEAAPSQTATSQPNWTPTLDTRLDPRQWRTWPAIPEVSARAVEVYIRGLEMGNDPNAFSKIGDCQSQPPVFFGIYDTADRYFLSEDYAYLQRSIDNFTGSYSRESAAVDNGLSVASVFSPLWARDESCESGENPLECEFRVQNPSIVFISLGTNWQPGSEFAFEEHLRNIVEFAIAEGVVPILVTKADNVEEDNRLNESIARVAYDYDMPLWNFWRTVQHLPNHGVDPELKGGLIYLIVEAWNIKSFTGLQALDAVWDAVSEN
ncbi:MAG: SGNH/GDSL hydrolase family protein [Chloroflexi bacterium]|nr:SGNH/GDSL hydrolase family protein [Chloroflexota bacterium]